MARVLCGVVDGVAVINCLRRRLGREERHGWLVENCSAIVAIQPVRLLVSASLISQPIVFFSHNKSAPAELISPETNQRICRLMDATRVLQAAADGRRRRRATRAKQSMLLPNSLWRSNGSAVKLASAGYCTRATRACSASAECVLWGLGRRRIVRAGVGEYLDKG